jgi:hypothetical protein
MIKLNEKEKKFKNHTELKFDVDLQFRRLRRNWGELGVNMASVCPQAAHIHEYLTLPTFE